MTPIEVILTTIAGEPIQLRTHPTAGVHRYIPASDPAASPNAAFWRARGAGGWYEDAGVAAAALAHAMGLRQGRAEGAPLPRINGKVETKLMSTLDALAADGRWPTESTLIDAAVASLPPATGRDRRPEAVKRALAGLLRRGTLKVDAGRIARCHTRGVASGEP